MLFRSTGLERNRINEILTMRLYPRAGETLAKVIRHLNDLNLREVKSTGSRCLPGAKILYVRVPQDGVYRAKPRQATVQISGRWYRFSKVLSHRGTRILKISLPEQEGPTQAPVQNPLEASYDMHSIVAHPIERGGIPSDSSRYHGLRTETTIVI